MNLYVNIEIKHPKAISSIIEGVYITVNTISELKEKVITHNKKYNEFHELISYKLVARLDGSCSSIEKKYYQKEILN